MSARRNSLLRSTSGAVAPTVALSLFGLIAAGGIAFDYARMASLDSELQTAADQAALAAATQLDGKGNACSRAASAASGLIRNDTRFANDSAGLAVTIANEGTCDRTGFIKFYTNKDRSDTGTLTDANANFVEVTVNSRTAFFALTPIVSVFSSGALSATAYAGVGQAICKVPPVMICNPQETGGNTSFDVSQFIGKGLKLVSVGNGGGAWVPGNFGYLDTGGGSNGAPGLREALGWTSPPGDCVEATGVDTKPGATVSVTDAVNTRFDIYDSNVACPTGGSCPASINSIKDVVRPANANGNNACGFHNQGWQEVGAAGQYLPSSATTALPTTTTPLTMGHPRDMCHAAPSSATGYCSGPIGDGNWDRDAYFRTNYNWSSTDWRTNTGLSTSVAVTAANYASRYNVYTWEIAHRGQSIGGATILGPRTASGNGASALTAYGAPVCSSAQGYGTGSVPGGTVVDRRRISVAVVNCTANNVRGNSTGVPVEEWMDAFIVEPSYNRARTSAGDVYVEPIAETSAGANGQTQAQVIQRSVPYLIE
ncbi:hypothetical protein TomTYG75_03200 [Sphingobium sp. TomTYG75]